MSLNSHAFTELCPLNFVGSGNFEIGVSHRHVGCRPLMASLHVRNMSPSPLH